MEFQERGVPQIEIWEPEEQSNERIHTGDTVMQQGTISPSLCTITRKEDDTVKSGLQQ